MGHFRWSDRRDGPRLLGFPRGKPTHTVGRPAYGHRCGMTTTASRAGRTARNTASKARGSRALRWPARAGLAARGLFYLLLASLAIRIASDSAGSRQADPNGALQVVGSKPLGLVVLGAAAFGFASFAIA